MESIKNLKLEKVIKLTLIFKPGEGENDKKRTRKWETTAVTGRETGI